MPCSFPYTIFMPGECEDFGGILEINNLDIQVTENR